MAPAPWYTMVLFVLTVAGALAFFLVALRKGSSDFPSHVPVFLTVWLIAVGVLGWIGWYQNTEAFPPRVMITVLVPVIYMVCLFLVKRSRLRVLRMNQQTLTLLHTLRVPVELVLWWLFQSGLVPEVMTFEGLNFDIFAGLTAPIVVYLAYEKRWIGKSLLIMWNILALGLLLNVVYHAALSLPGPLQMMSFDMPNLAVTYFPFIWLPTFVVPVVLFAHVVCLVQLFRAGKPMR